MEVVGKEKSQKKKKIQVYPFFFVVGGGNELKQPHVMMLHVGDIVDEKKCTPKLSRMFEYASDCTLRHAARQRLGD